MRRACLYARVSSRKRSQDTSPARQLEQLREYAKRRGWTVVQEAAERKTGRSLVRPELHELLELLRTRKADVLLVVDLDRLGRNLVGLVELADDLGRWGAGLVCLRFGDGDLDTTSAQGRMFFQVVGAFAEFLSNLHAEKVRDGLEVARSSGKRLGRPPAIDDANLVRVMDLRRMGLSLRQIATEIRIPLSTVHRALKNVPESPPQNGGPSPSRKAG